MTLPFSQLKSSQTDLLREPPRISSIMMRLRFDNSAMKLLKFLSRKGPLRILKRLWISMVSITPTLLIAVRWSFARTEDSNFYYPLDTRSEINMAHSLATIFGVSREHVLIYFSELMESSEFLEARRALRNEDFVMRNSSLEPGRRLAWYAVVRIMQPKVVLETGVHQGVGAFALCMALAKNYEETGVKGKYFGTDLRANAGALVKSSAYQEYFHLLEGDSVGSIQRLEEEIDLYVSDSDHFEGYETKELLVTATKLSAKAVVISDNSHATSVLSDWSDLENRNFAFLEERPTNHWYRGAGVGLSYPKSFSPKGA